ncbi:MAG: ATP-binding protein [Myxococcaceae bacterium]
MDTPLEPGALNFRWLLRLRWGAALGQLALVLSVQPFLGVRVPVGALVLVISAELLSNAALSRWARTSPRLLASDDGAENAIAAVMAADFVLLTILFALSGGPNNPFSVLYLVEVALAAVMLDPRRTWALMGFALACFGTLFLTPRLPWLVAHGLSHEQMMELHIRGMWVAFGVAAAFIVVFVQRVTRALAARDAELAEARSQAARRERLASLATLAAGAAHELSTPLSTIAVVARELERQLASHPEAAADARLIRDEVERCRRTLTRMANDAGAPSGESGGQEPLSRVVEEALEGLAGREQVRVEALGDLGRSAPLLPVRALGRSAQALVRNALQASPAGAEVVLRVEATAAALRLEVSDHGAGIPPEVLPRVGEPFFTTRQPGAGMGLGVFLARSLSEQLGGSFSLTSQPGSGTRAVVQVPLAAECAPPSPSQPLP